MVTFYESQVAQVNDEPPSKSSLDLTLMQNPCDEDPKLQEMHVRLEVEPPRAWYYHISPNFCTLVILLQLDSLLVMNLRSSMKVIMKLKTL
jgi:hypothetical protein